MKDPDVLRQHTDDIHQLENLELVVHDRTMNNRNKDAAVKIDVKNISCRLCPQPVSDLEQLLHHIIISHDAQYDTSVANCVLPFVLDKDNFLCPSCNMKFIFFEYLVRHANKHHLSHNYMCDVCGTSFQGENYLKMHSRYYHKEGGYKCDYCDVVYTTLSKKTQHERTVHLVNLWACPHCSASFKSGYLKRIHLANDHGVEEMKVKCPHCPKVYPQESIMSRHMRRVHLKEKNVKCDVCGDKFFGAYDLKLHMVKHNEEAKIVCNVCGKKFCKKSSLNAHMLLHTQSFVCDICDQYFNKLVNLKSHIKNVHPGYHVVEQEQGQESEEVVEAVDSELIHIEILKDNGEVAVVDAQGFLVDSLDETNVIYTDQ